MEMYAIALTRDILTCLSLTPLSSNSRNARVLQQQALERTV